LQITAQKKSVQQNIDPDSVKGGIAIGKVALGLSVIAVLSKVFGFTEKLIVAHFFGTDAQADVYFASMGIVLSLVFLVKELIYPSVLPVFAGALKTSFAASSALFKKVFFRLLAVLATFAFIMALFSDAITSVLVPGFSEDKKLLTSSLLRYLAPGCLLLCMTTLTYAVLNCRRNFLKAAIPEAVFKLLTAAGLIMLAPFMGIYALAVVVTAGSVMVFVVQFFFIPEGRVVLAKKSYSPDSEFQKTLTLMGPLVLGVVFSHVSGLVDNMLASTLPTGQLSFLGYSKKLIDAILLVGPVALVTVVYSQLSLLNAEGKQNEFRALFIRVLRLIIFVSLPASVVLVMLREPVIAALFERGRFTARSTAGTSQALFIYAVGFVTFAVESLVVFGFYALSNTKTPVRAGIFGVLLNIILAVSLVGPFGFAAIAWAYVFSKTVKVVILLWIMNRKFRFLHKGGFINFILKVTVSCLASAFCLYFLQGLSQGSSSLQKFAFDLAIPATGFASAFILCCLIFKIEEIKLLSAVLVRRKSLKSQLRGDIP
jgi:putative peptidoglycan lipid II flippase